MKDMIGKTAERVWLALNEGEALTLAALGREIHAASSTEIAMAVGWLVRENKVDFTWQNRLLKVRTLSSV